MLSREKAAQDAIIEINAKLNNLGNGNGSSGGGGGNGCGCSPLWLIGILAILGLIVWIIELICIYF